MEKSNFEDFAHRLSMLISKNPKLLIVTLSNIFTMRLIGNKTHGDLAEIGITEFINQFMYDFKAQHVGKDLFRSKKSEEDILVTNEMTGNEIPISLKAYGNGPLQISTDKKSEMFTLLSHIKKDIFDKNKITSILNSKAFNDARKINVLPLIYDEKKKKCNIMVFNFSKAISECNSIQLIMSGKKRKHPVYRFFDKTNNYIMEVRYGGAAANALQRGLWTHTKLALPFFESITKGWIDYQHNMTLVNLFSKALISTNNGHKNAVTSLDEDIETLKNSMKQ